MRDEIEGQLLVAEEDLSKVKDELGGQEEAPILEDTGDMSKLTLEEY